MKDHKFDEIAKEKDLGIDKQPFSIRSGAGSYKRVPKMSGAININESYKSEEVVIKLYLAYKELISNII